VRGGDKSNGELGIEGASEEGLLHKRGHCLRWELDMKENGRRQMQSGKTSGRGG